MHGSTVNLSVWSEAGGCQRATGSASSASSCVRMVSTTAGGAGRSGGRGGPPCIAQQIERGLEAGTPCAPPMDARDRREAALQRRGPVEAVRAHAAPAGARSPRGRATPAPGCRRRSRRTAHGRTWWPSRPAREVVGRARHVLGDLRRCRCPTPSSRRCWDAPRARHAVDRQVDAGEHRHVVEQHRHGRRVGHRSCSGARTRRPSSAP